MLTSITKTRMVTTSQLTDVKYHLGTTLERKYGKDQVDIRLTLMANPSHLEAVNPCVGGRARAEQHFIGGDD